jgi:glycosyltransferase involved in cell wall biosynthesis
MKQAAKVSVLMSVYNTDFSLVKRAVNSVLRQDFQNFELIIIDDGSDNDTEHQLLSYVKKYEDKITYLRHANCGQSRSINKGVLLSKGDYITVIDADDEYKPHHLSACLSVIKPFDLIASTTETVVDSEEDYYVADKFDNSKMIHVDNCILFATLFGKREVFEDIKFGNIYAADAAFYDFASEKYDVKKVNLRTYIYYRNMPNSISALVKKQHLVSLS